MYHVKRTNELQKFLREPYGIAYSLIYGFRPSHLIFECNNLMETEQSVYQLFSLNDNSNPVMLL